MRADNVLNMKLPSKTIIKLQGKNLSLVNVLMIVFFGCYKEKLDPILEQSQNSRTLSILKKA
jgi:hypothetical protein